MPATTPTQTRHPWRATARTILQVGVSLGIVVSVGWAALSEELQKQHIQIPAEVSTQIGVSVGLVVALSATLTRIMAIPQVDSWLRYLGLSAAPASPLDQTVPAPPVIVEEQPVRYGPGIIYDGMPSSPEEPDGPDPDVVSDADGYRTI